MILGVVASSPIFLKTEDEIPRLFLYLFVLMLCYNFLKISVRCDEKYLDQGWCCGASWRGSL